MTHSGHALHREGHGIPILFRHPASGANVEFRKAANGSPCLVRDRLRCHWKLSHVTWHGPHWGHHIASEGASSAGRAWARERPSTSFYDMSSGGTGDSMI
jgi:hypothetical protein